MLRRRQNQDVRCWHLLFGQTRRSAPTVGGVTPSKKRTPIAGSASSERFNLAREVSVSSFLFQDSSAFFHLGRAPLPYGRGWGEGL